MAGERRTSSSSVGHRGRGIAQAARPGVRHDAPDVDEAILEEGARETPDSAGARCQRRCHGRPGRVDPQEARRWTLDAAARGEFVEVIRAREARPSATLRAGSKNPRGRCFPRTLDLMICGSRRRFMIRHRMPSFNPVPVMQLSRSSSGDDGGRRGRGDRARSRSGSGETVTREGVAPTVHDLTHRRADRERVLLNSMLAGRPRLASAEDNDNSAPENSRPRTTRPGRSELVDASVNDTSLDAPLPAQDARRDLPSPPMIEKPLPEAARQRRPAAPKGSSPTPRGSA
jgi:hypothetical protein